MIGLESILTYFNAIKTAVDTLRGLKSLRSDPKGKAALETLEEALLDARALAGEAQLRELELHAKLRELQNQVDELNSRHFKLDGYEEVPYGKGKSALRLKSSSGTSDNALYACPKCVGDKHISHLQYQHQTFQGLDLFRCHKCDGEFLYGDSNGDSGVRVVKSGRSSVFDL
ncbi:MAG: hypothetical protein ACFB01_14835 [Cohaesibacteraceae bacterium]